MYSNGKIQSNPLSKIHKEGIKYLESMDWNKIDYKLNDSMIPIFSLSNRKEVNKYEYSFKYKSFELPFIRQLPQQITDLLDNKKLLSLKIKSNQYSFIMPETFENISDFIQTQSNIDCIWYLKHIKGCKGKQIELFNNINNLKLYFKHKNKRKMQDFIIQKEIVPLLTKDDKKFAIRAHVAVILNNNNNNNSNKFQLFFHKQCIILPNAKCYDPQNISDKTIHIQQIGKKLPKPFLLNSNNILLSLKNIHHIFEQMYDITNKVFLCINKEIIDFQQECYNNNIIGKYYHLFGFDFMIDQNEKVLLLEINAFPAIGNGTMINVDKSIFTQLIKDLVSVIFHANYGNFARLQ